VLSTPVQCLSARMCLCAVPPQLLPQVQERLLPSAEAVHSTSTIMYCSLSFRQWLAGQACIERLSAATDTACALTHVKSMPRLNLLYTSLQHCKSLNHLQCYSCSGVPNELVWLLAHVLHLHQWHIQTVCSPATDQNSNSMHTCMAGHPCMQIQMPSGIVLQQYCIGQPTLHAPCSVCWSAH
jgi:hypothetical protein